jgi:hypothetical protein
MEQQFIGFILGILVFVIFVADLFLSSHKKESDPELDN